MELRINRLWINRTQPVTICVFPILLQCHVTSLVQSDSLWQGCAVRTTGVLDQGCAQDYLYIWHWLMFNRKLWGYPAFSPTFQSFPSHPTITIDDWKENWCVDLGFQFSKVQHWYLWSRLLVLIPRLIWLTFLFINYFAHSFSLELVLTLHGNHSTVPDTGHSLQEITRLWWRWQGLSSDKGEINSYFQIKLPVCW